MNSSAVWPCSDLAICSSWSRLCRSEPWIDLLTMFWNSVGPTQTRTSRTLLLLVVSRCEARRHWLSWFSHDLDLTSWFSFSQYLTTTRQFKGHVVICNMDVERGKSPPKVALSRLTVSGKRCFLLRGGATPRQEATSKKKGLEVLVWVGPLWMTKVGES